MRIRITNPPTEASVDGLGLADFRVGATYAVPAELATLMIVEGWAEPVDADAIPILPAFRFHIVPSPAALPLARRPPHRRRFTDRLLTPGAGLAAERKKRKPPAR